MSFGIATGRRTGDNFAKSGPNSDCGRGVEIAMFGVMEMPDYEQMPVRGHRTRIFRI
jgi:hypothetical protein